jgi:hypothetical protein
MLFGGRKDVPTTRSNNIISFSHTVEVELSPLPVLAPVLESQAGADDAIPKLDAAYFPRAASADKAIPFRAAFDPAPKRRSTIHVMEPFRVAAGSVPCAWSARGDRHSEQVVRRQDEYVLEEL